MMSVTPQKRGPFNADFSRGKGKIQLETVQEYEGYSSVVTLFLAKKSLTKIVRCAGALS